MKKIALFIALTIGLTSLRFADELSKYAINTVELKSYVRELATLNAFPSFSFYMPKNIRELGQKLPEAEKIALSKAVGMFVKGYVSSPTFKSELAKMLDDKKESTNLQSAEWKETYQNAYNGQLRDIQENANLGVYNDEYFTAHQSMLDMLKKNSDENPESNPEVLAILKRTTANTNAIIALKPLLKSDKSAFMKKLATIQATNSIDEQIEDIKKRNSELDQKKEYQQNIKAQLQQFLDETAEVEYDAPTKGKNGMIEFVKPEHKQKPRIWKQAYRIGKPSMMVFRNIAEEWLKELE